MCTVIESKKGAFNMGLTLAAQLSLSQWVGGFGKVSGDGGL